MHKVFVMYLELLKQVERFRLCFSRLHNEEKDMNNAFSSYELTTKLCLVYLEVKLQQNRCSCCIEE